MTTIKIKKIEEEVTSSVICTTHTFTVNGKKVRAYEYQNSGDEQNDPDYNLDADPNDIKALTDEEHEVFGENLNDLCDSNVKVGQATDITYE